MLVLLIPENIVIKGWEYTTSVQDILLSMTIAIVLFSIFVKTLSLGPLIKKLGLDTLDDIETLQLLFEKIILLENSLKRIDYIRAEKYIDEEEGNILKKEYQEEYDTTKEKLNAFLTQK
jgi:hypothetical protein